MPQNTRYLMYHMFPLCWSHDMSSWKPKKSSKLLGHLLSLNIDASTARERKSIFILGHTHHYSVWGPERRNLLKADISLSSSSYTWSGTLDFRKATNFHSEDIGTPAIYVQAEEGGEEQPVKRIYVYPRWARIPCLESLGPEEDNNMYAPVSRLAKNKAGYEDSLVHSFQGIGLLSGGLFEGLSVSDREHMLRIFKGWWWATLPKFLTKEVRHIPRLLLVWWDLADLVVSNMWTVYVHKSSAFLYSTIICHLSMFTTPVSSEYC